MSLLQLPFETIEAIINKLDADSLLKMMKAVPDPYRDIQRNILSSLLQHATDEIWLKEYLCTCQPSFDLLKECLLRFKRRGQLYIIAQVLKEVMNPTIGNKYIELSRIEGLQEQDLMESVRDLVKQGLIEPAKKFLLADSKYNTKMSESLAIYAIEHKLNNFKQFEWIEEIEETHQCGIPCICKAPWKLLKVLEQAHREAEQGNVRDCEDRISQANHIASSSKLPEPDTRQMEKTMYHVALCSALQRLQQRLQKRTPLTLHDLGACRFQIKQAQLIAEEGGLFEPETAKLMEMIDTLEKRNYQIVSVQIRNSGLSKSEIERRMKLIKRYS